MTDDTIYNVRVTEIANRLQLLYITGRRETVTAAIEAALRVILDSAPDWTAHQWPSPAFGIDVSKVSA